ncbi:MAG: ABC transporter ATP-binding protein [Candidatus Lokiarchaeota archaeon]|nr:ABC transporter ATP-binding protein [Candidatus Lokiarchaeota archaeon]
MSNLKRSNNNTKVEFSIENDPFINFRDKSPSRWILAHILNGSNKTNICIVLITTIIAAMLSSTLMIIVGETINDLLLGKESALLINILLILIIGIGAPLMRIGNFMLREVIAQRIERDTRKEFYLNLLGKSQSFHDQQKIGDLMARTTNDVRMLNYLISPALSLIIESFTSLIIPLGYIVIFYPPELVIIPLIFIFTFIVALRDYIKKIGPITEKLRGDFGEMNIVLNESISGITLIKSTVQEAREKHKYLMTIKGYRDAFVEQGKVQAKYVPILLLALMNTVSLAHAIILFLNNSMTIGQIIGYLGLLSEFRFPTFISFFVFAIIKLAGAGAKRLLELMNKKTEIDENLEGESRKIIGNIEFENVSFYYPGFKNRVLQNISFKIKQGQTLAIVGTTGSGKTTLTKLITRLYDVSEGRILIDNIDIRKYILKSLRSQVSYIEQDVFLFSNSIIDNISFGKKASFEEVRNAAILAQAHDFISSLPKSYDSEIGERGIQLSGGERQRIALARAFLVNPRILILDDSTSAIDSKTEDEIQKAINKIEENRTTIIITHRLSQIRWADLIIVLKSGKVVAQGTHEYLIENSPEYRKIFIKKFDLEEDKLITRSGRK